MTRVASRYSFVQTEYLDATLSLVKRLEISKELIRKCVTVPIVVVAACHAAYSLDGFVSSYVHKNTLLAATCFHSRLPVSIQHSVHFEEPCILNDTSVQTTEQKIRINPGSTVVFYGSNCY